MCMACNLSVICPRQVLVPELQLCFEGVLRQHDSQSSLQYLTNLVA